LLSQNCEKCDFQFSTPELEKFSKACQEFNEEFIKHKTPLADRNQYHNFLQSGRFWMVHLRHVYACDNDKDCDVIFDALEQWYATLFQTYNAQIFNPHRTFNPRSLAINRLKGGKEFVEIRKQEVPQDIPLKDMSYVSLPLEEDPRDGGNNSDDEDDHDPKNNNNNRGPDNLEGALLHYALNRTREKPKEEKMYLYA